MTRSRTRLSKPRFYVLESKAKNTEDGSPNTEQGETDDNNVIKIYYNTDNDRLYHGNDIQYFEIDGEVSFHPS